MKRKAFSIIELSVAISAMVIISAIVIVGFSMLRRNSRDTRRKADVQTLSSAVQQYTVYKGTSFVRSRGQTCDTKNPLIGGSSETGVLIPSEGKGCVGAHGLSFGKVSLIDTNIGTSPDFGKPDLDPPTTNGYGPYEARKYRKYSIAGALLEDGFLNSQPKDPLSKTAGDSTDPNERDYVMIRGCKTGWQNVGSTGSYVAIWAALEGTPETADVDNSKHLPGGREAGPVDPTDIAKYKDYVFDFGAQAAEYTSGAYYLNGYASGSGTTPVVGLTSAAGCGLPSTAAHVAG